MTIGDHLSAQAKTRPEALALIDERAGRTLTFAQLDDEVARAAAWWRACGLRRGQAVLVFVPMSAELYVALLAIFRIGAVALFLDPSAGRNHLEQCCARWAPDAFLAITKAHLLRMRSRALRAIPLKISLGGWLPRTRRWLAGETSERLYLNAAQPADAALVTFTSGSTGVPKAAVRTQAFLLAQYRALTPSIELHTGDVDLATLPVFTLANLAAGVTTVIPAVDLRRPCAVDAAKIWSQIERHAVTRITASPAFFERLVEEGLRRGETLARLNKLYTGGAPVFPRLLESLRGLVPNAEVVAVYGSTEAEPIAHVAAKEIQAADLAAMRDGRGLLAGRPVAEIKLRVISDRWGTPRGKLSASTFANEVLLPGEIGEIVVAGEHVLTGYMGGVGDEETKFHVDGKVWHRTGDAGRIDEYGRLWLAGRCAACVEDAHGKLYPFGVECVAMTFPLVRRAALVACNGKRLLIVEAERCDELASALRAATAWALVDEVRFVHAMPLDKRHNAKIDYPALHRMLDE
jgi:acyl-CoA synthetase (AMP-forming)/AMP-acid ligase II